MVKNAKENYFENKIEENYNNPKKLWEQFKTLGYSNKQKDKANTVLEIDKEITHDAGKIVNHFNVFFTSIAESLVAKLPQAEHIFDTCSNIFKRFYRKVFCQNLFLELSSVNEDFVLRELEKLNVSKSTGLDGIPSRFLKDGAQVLAKPITFLINMSITSGIVPDEMKQARVCPIYKKNNRLDVGNYRPVSILIIVSKILERAVYNQLEYYLNKNNLLYELQSGFRSKYSTDTCLIHLLDHIKSQTARGLYTGMIMLDLQKAFDTVDHQILCKKLQTMGVLSIRWFESYLTDRQQKVSANGTESDFLCVKCGVPQGSILGPLLFLCYVNDMSASVGPDCKLLLYADDSAILFSDKNPDIISAKLSQELQSCSKWLVDNKLSLHLGKTECILFGTKRKLKKIKEFSVTCNNHTILSQNSVKYLGLQIDQFLSGDIIVNSILQKANARLKFLYRNAKCLSEHSRKTLCMALIQCHFDYACSAWFNNVNKTLQNKLQIMQNKIIRFIKGLDYRHRVDYTVFDNVGFLNVSNRVRQMRLNHAHKIYYNKCPHYMRTNFVKTRDIISYNTRHNEYNFYVPSVNGQSANTFYYNAIKDWNGLPSDIKKIKSSHAFKSKVKLFLFDKMKENFLDVFTI